MKGNFEMNQILGGILGSFILIAVVFIFLYNSLVNMDVAVSTAWADLESQYQRRIDLIPNIVNTVKGYMTFESSLLEEITQLRSQWSSASNFDDKVSAGSALESALGRLIVVYENYPDLQSIESVNTLMVQLEGTENRIAVARRDYNHAVRSYNTAIRSFPSNLIAGMTGMSQPKPLFESQEGADIAPVVQLSG